MKLLPFLFAVLIMSAVLMIAFVVSKVSDWSPEMFLIAVVLFKQVHEEMEGK